MPRLIGLITHTSTRSSSLLLINRVCVDRRSLGRKRQANLALFLFPFFLYIIFTVYTPSSSFIAKRLKLYSIRCCPWFARCQRPFRFFSFLFLSTFHECNRVVRITSLHSSPRDRNSLGEFLLFRRDKFGRELANLSNPLALIQLVPQPRSDLVASRGVLRWRYQIQHSRNLFRFASFIKDR